MFASGNTRNKNIEREIYSQKDRVLATEYPNMDIILTFSGQFQLDPENQLPDSMLSEFYELMDALIKFNNDTTGKPEIPCNLLNATKIPDAISNIIINILENKTDIDVPECSKGCGIP